VVYVFIINLFADINVDTILYLVSQFFKYNPIETRCAVVLVQSGCHYDSHYIKLFILKKYSVSL